MRPRIDLKCCRSRSRDFLRQIPLHRNTKGASNRNRIFTILCLFARFHSRERRIGRRTASMCSFMISNKNSISLSSKIYRSSQGIQPVFLNFVLRLVHNDLDCRRRSSVLQLHLHHFRPKTNSEHQYLSHHIDYS